MDDEALFAPEYDELHKKNRVLTVIVVILCVTQLLTGYLWYKSGRKPGSPESLVAVNQDDPFIVERAKEFDLPRVIEKYDQIINAIEYYHQDHGTYPRDLSSLVPQYLSKVPGIYIRNGEKLTYKPAPDRSGGAPFTFYIYGHYPGLAFMHGWELKYCPVELDLCNEIDDRHYHPHRINHRWIWVSRSAL
jgi:hypothetical protein